MVANLPYYITKDVLRQMLPMSDRISHLHFMLQVSLQRSSYFEKFIEQHWFGVCKLPTLSVNS